MSDVVKQVDYLGVIEELVPGFFKGGARNLAINTSIAARMQELENALWQLFTERGVDVAVGDALDKLGALVGVARDGLLDDDYRRLVNARLLSNRSDGTGDLLLQVINLLSDTTNAVYSPLYPAAMAFQLIVPSFFDPAFRNRLGSWMQEIAGAGIEIDSIAEAEVGSFCFGIDETTPEIVGGGGLSEESTVFAPSTFGGKWAEDWIGTMPISGRLIYYPSLLDGMVGSWELDDNAADTVVEEVFQNLTGTATVNTSTISVAGVIDEAFDFDGITEGVDLTTHISTIGVLSEGTISFWIKQVHDGTLRVIFSVSDNLVANTEWALAVLNGHCGIQADELGNNSIPYTATKSTNPIANGAWTFVAVTVDSTGIRWYLDSVLDKTITTYTKFFDQFTNNSCNIARTARSFGAYNKHYAGVLDSLRLHNRALTQSEITTLYNGGSGLPF